MIAFHAAVFWAGVVLVGRLASARGRFAIGWALAAAFASASGAVLTVRVPDHSLIEVILPALASIVAVAAIAFALYKLPIKTSTRSRCPIDDLTGEAPGQLTIKPDRVEISVLGRVRSFPRAALHTVAAEGECLRLSWELDGARHNIRMVPRGRPDTPDGRKAQSQALADRLRTIPVAKARSRR